MAVKKDRKPPKQKYIAKMMCDYCQHRKVCRYEADQRQAYKLLYDTFYTSSEGIFKQIHEHETAELIIRCTMYLPESAWRKEQKQLSSMTFAEAIEELKREIAAADGEKYVGGEIAQWLNELEQIWWEKENIKEGELIEGAGTISA